MPERLGLVCGLGSISKIAERLAREAGYEPLSVKLGSIRTAISLVFRLGDAPIRPAEIMRFFREREVKKIAIVGKFPKSIMFASFTGDEHGSRVANASDKRDVSIYRIVRRELEAQGFELVPQADLLRPLLAPEDGYWGPEPDDGVMSDLERGLELAR
ncbi:MAG TPA: DUF1009 domain-containing protein, partial [Proteobacteria bacterium]|nr:DUF1009 domain-containing protein [Pseudomonadota bacterium]